MAASMEDSGITNTKSLHRTISLPGKNISVPETLDPDAIDQEYHRKLHPPKNNQNNQKENILDDGIILSRRNIQVQDDDDGEYSSMFSHQSISMKSKIHHPVNSTSIFSTGVPNCCAK
jgi:hypothetical protein